MVIGERGIEIADRRAQGEGFKTSVPASGGSGGATQPDGAESIDAAPYWSQVGSNCYSALYRGSSYMDTCYRMYWMANDGSSQYDYWRLDLYATMSAAGRILDWGSIHADQDGGPQMSFVDWSPNGDQEISCQPISLSVTVLGVGAGYGYTQCELWDITKTAGSTLGSFQNRWSWGTRLPLRGADRGVALELGTRSTPGTVVWGLSWDFAAHG